MSEPYDSGDYDTGDRIKCHDCSEWGWTDSGDIKVCPKCEEQFCVDCMKEHECASFS